MLQASLPVWCDFCGLITDPLCLCGCVGSQSGFDEVCSDDLVLSQSPHAALYGSQDFLQPPVQSQEVWFGQDGEQRVRIQGLSHDIAQSEARAGQQLQADQCGALYQTALVERSQDGHFIMRRFSKSSCIVQVKQESFIPEFGEDLIVVPT